MTSSRRLLLATLFSGPSHRAAEEVAEPVRVQAPNVGISTIFPTLAHLEMWASSSTLTWTPIRSLAIWRPGPPLIACGKNVERRPRHPASPLPAWRLRLRFASGARSASCTSQSSASVPIVERGTTDV
jgi:hypothetical protein